MASEWVKQGITRPGQLFLFQWIEPAQKVTAIDQFIARLRSDDELDWNTDMIRLSVKSNSELSGWKTRVPRQVRFSVSR